MTQSEDRELEDAQWRAANKQEKDGDAELIQRLTKKLRAERGEPDATESGVVGDENKDGQPDGSQERKEDRTNDSPVRKSGVTTTKNING